MEDPRTERERIEELRDEARYRQQRLALYRARHYGGRASDPRRLAELQRAYDGAAARLARAKAKARPNSP